MGVEAEIWEAVDGPLTGHDTRMLALGNPADASSAFNKCIKRSPDATKAIVSR